MKLTLGQSFSLASLGLLASTFAPAIALTSAIVLAAPAGAGPSAKNYLIYLSVESAMNESGSPLNFAGRVTLEKDEAEVVLFQAVTATEMNTQAFHCHAEVSATGELEGSHCHDEGVGQPSNHQLGAPVLKRESILASLESALSVFESRIAKLDTVSEVKFWQHSDELTVKFTSGSPAAENFFMCHKHGASFDCHRSRRAGPNEPKTRH